MKIPMSSPDIGQAEIQAVLDVVRSPALSMGPKVGAFEESFADLVGANHGVAVSSGTAGLHMCMVAAGVGRGDLVVTSPFSFVASANAILYEGGIPIFVDVDERTGNIDSAQVERAMTEIAGGDRRAWMPPAHDPPSNGELRALLPVHVFGQPAKMDALCDSAKELGLSVIEDACEAVGAHYNGRPAGSFGNASVFAFYPNKQITTGEGGLIVTNDEEWDTLFRSLRNQGRDVFDAWLEHSRLGFNYRMDELSAALGLAQVTRFRELSAGRERVADLYQQRLNGVEGLSLPDVAPSTTTMSWFVYVVRFESDVERRRAMSELEAVGVPSRPYFRPIHLQPFYRQRFGWHEGQFPVAERLGETSLALPFSGVMTEGQVDYVSDHLERVLHV